MKRRYDYPLWTTQGGGLAKESNGTYIFIEKPNHPSLDVGDEVPDDWDLKPVNMEAHGELYRREWEQVGPPKPGSMLHTLYAGLDREGESIW